VLKSPTVDARPDQAPRLQWEAEQLVSASLAAELVGLQFPRLHGAPAELLATGWDNTVYLLGGQWIFRFPRRGVALPGIRREIAILPRLAEAELPNSARAQAGASVGKFLRALHHPHLADLAGLAESGLPEDPMQRADPRTRTARAREPLERLARSAAWVPDPAVERLFGAVERLGPPAGRPVLVHGDLHLRHLLVGQSGDASGVIDWGDVCLADPAVDLSLAYSGFAGPARAALLAAYGPVDAERELRARVLAVSLCASLAEYAHSDGRARLLRGTLAGPRRAVAG
jgi:Phosphotransferase enzyme family